jgi:hypothetical protein
MNVVMTPGHCRDIHTECTINRRWFALIQALYLQVSESNVREELARKVAGLVVLEVLAARFVYDIVTQDCSQRTAAGSGLVYHFGGFGARYQFHLVRIAHQSVHDHVRSDEIAKLVRKKVESDEGTEIAFFAFGQEFDIADIDALHVVGKHLRVVVLEGCGLLLFVPCGRSRCSEELGPWDKEIGVERETLLLLSHKDVESVTHAETGGSQQCSVRGPKVVVHLHLCALCRWRLICHGGVARGLVHHFEVGGVW